MRTLLTLLLTACCTVGAADEKAAFKRYKQLWNAGKQKEACEALGEADTLRATKTLGAVALRHGQAGKPETVDQENDRLEILEGAINGLAKMRLEKAVTLIFKSAGQRSLRPPLRAPFIRSLGLMKTKTAAGHLLALRKKTRLGMVKIEIALAMGVNLHPSLGDGWIEDFSSPYWQVQAAAIRSVGKQPARKAISPLIQEIEGKSPLLEHEAWRVLVALSGQDFGAQRASWKSWWDTNKETWKPPVKVKMKEEKKPEEKKSEEKKPEEKKSDEKKPDEKKEEKPESKLWAPSWFGIPFYSKRILFLMDHTTSMFNNKLTEEVVIPEDANEDPQHPLGWDWSEIKNRYDLVRAQMAHTIAQLDPRTEFNIYFISSGIKQWQKGRLVKATDANKRAAIVALRKLGNAKTYSDLYGPLELAFAYPSPSVERQLRKGVDTIFALLDSIPYGGKINKRNQRKYQIPFVRAVMQWNGRRQVTLNTIGIGKDHPEDLFRLLSQTNNGKYASAR